jgi:hypothetical protein
MKPKLPLRSVVVLLMSFWFIGVSQSVHASSFESYVKDVFYIGVGGMPPTLSDFAAHPRAYLRLEAAYQSLKQGFEESLNRSLSDSEFQTLLASDQVRADLDCVGRITTAGISEAGAVGWSNRKCYSDEKLIELQVNGRWQVVASQGCFNLVRPQMEPIPAVPQLVTIPTEPQPEVISEEPQLKLVPRSPLLSSPEVFVQETRGIVVHSCDCPGSHSCHSDIYLPSYRAYLVR